MVETAEHPQRFAAAVVAQLQQAVARVFAKAAVTFASVDGVLAARSEHEEITGLQRVLMSAGGDGATAFEQKVKPGGAGGVRFVHHMEGRLQVAVHFDAGLQVEQLKQAVNAVQCHSPYCVLPHYNGAFFGLL